LGKIQKGRVKSAGVERKPDSHSLWVVRGRSVKAILREPSLRTKRPSVARRGKSNRDWKFHKRNSPLSCGGW